MPTLLELDAHYFVHLLQVILWIRLSVTFGYPAALPGLRTISKVFGEIPEFKDTSYTSPPAGLDESTPPEQYSTLPYILSGDDATVTEKSKTSLYYTHYPFDVESQPEPNDTRIISIVRVSSTSIVKPKRSERVTKSVSANTSKNYYSIFNNLGKRSTLEIANRSDVSYENIVTPFVSLLRENRLDVDENGPRETPNTSASSTRLSYTPNHEAKFPEPTSRYFGGYSSITNAALYRHSKSVNATTSSTEMKTEQITDAFTEVYQTSRAGKSDSTSFESYDEEEYTEQRAYGKTEKVYGEPEKVYGEPEKVYGEPEKVYGEPEKMYSELEKVYSEPEKMYSEPEKVYGEPEKVYSEPEKNHGEPEKVCEEPEKYKSEAVHKDPETEFVKQPSHFELPESSENSNANSYSLFTTRVNDKKSSFIIDNGTHRKYRVEEKTPDGFIVGEYGMVSHRDGSLRGVRYTADSNINPSLIYETLVKFLSLK